MLFSASPACAPTQSRKSLRSSDFGGGCAKNGCVEQPRDRGFDRPGPPRPRAVLVARRAGARAHEIVDQRVGRAGVAGDRIVLAVDEGDVGDAAEIEHRDRMRPVERARQRAMKHRHQRRALPAGRHIGGAEVVDHRNAESRAPARRRRRSGPSACPSAGAARSGRGSRRHRSMSRSIPLAARNAFDRARRAAPSTCASASRDHARPLGARRAAPAPPPSRGAAARALVLLIGDAARSARTATTVSPSVSISATSMPSIDVPLISPIARIAAPRFYESRAGPVTPPARRQRRRHAATEPCR